MQPGALDVRETFNSGAHHMPRAGIERRVEIADQAVLHQIDLDTAEQLQAASEQDELDEDQREVLRQSYGLARIARMRIVRRQVGRIKRTQLRHQRGIAGTSLRSVRPTVYYVLCVKQYVQ